MRDNRKVPLCHDCIFDVTSSFEAAIFKDGRVQGELQQLGEIGMNMVSKVFYFIFSCQYLLLPKRV